MNKSSSSPQTPIELQPYLSPLAVWALSLGMAEYDRKADRAFHEVFKRADDLMYERKKQLKKMGATIRD